MIASDLSLPLGKGGPNLLSVTCMTLQRPLHSLYPHSTDEDVARRPHVATRGLGDDFWVRGWKKREWLLVDTGSPASGDSVLCRATLLSRGWEPPRRLQRQ